MARSKYEKDSIINNLLEFLNDTRIQKGLIIYNIKAEMVRYIIENHLYRILDEIKIDNILEKDNEFLLNSFCYHLMVDIIDTILYTKAKDTKCGLKTSEKDNPTYLKDLKKCKKDIENFLKEHFNLPTRNSISSYLIPNNTPIDLLEKIEFEWELFDYKVALDYIFADSDKKEYYYKILKERYKTYQKDENEPLTKHIEFNQITRLNIEYIDFEVFKNMIYSYFCFKGQIDKIENKLQDQKEFLQERYLIFNHYYKLGIKQEIDENRICKLIEKGYTKFKEQNPN